MSGLRRDIIVTWPKIRSFQSYMTELRCAQADGAVINYRVASPPATKPERCYVVHDGLIRGYNLVIDVTYHDGETVERVDDEGHWPEGWYIVRSPEFHPVTWQKAAEMTGFRGWRWFDRTLVGQ